MFKLMSIEPSDRPGKKWRANFYDSTTGRRRTIHFGQEGADDYTITQDKAQRDRYRTRHQKDLQTDAAKTGMSPGALSYYLLWGEHDNITKNLPHYKRLFNL